MSPTGDDSGDPMATEAGEYVIGTLGAQERAAFALKLRDDADARRAVAFWEARFAELTDHVDEVSPGPEVWTRIREKLETAAKPVPFRVIQGGSAAPALRIQKSRDRWRAAALVGGAVAAALIAFVAVRGGETDATSIAVVNRTGDKPALLVRVNLTSGRMQVTPVAAEIPAGHSLELWYIGAGRPPRSVGLVNTAPSTLKLPPGSKAEANASVAVSVEPVGGSKTGDPTGPVIYSGQLVPE